MDHILCHKVSLNKFQRPNTITAGLRLLSNSLLAVWPWLAFGKLDLGKIPTIPWQDCLTVPKLFMWTIWFMLNTCFPSGSLGFWCMLDRRCLTWPAPSKNPEHWSLMSFPGRKHFTCAVPTRCWKSWSHPRWSHWRRLLEAVSGFFWTSPHASSPFGAFCILYLVWLTAVNMTTRCVLWVLWRITESGNGFWEPLTHLVAEVGFMKMKDSLKYGKSIVWEKEGGANIINPWCLGGYGVTSGV